MGMPFLPESPTWLLLQGDVLSARQIMNRLGISETNSSRSILHDTDSVDHSSYRTFESSNEIRGREGSVDAPLNKRLWARKGKLCTACFVGVAQNVLCTNAALYFSTDLLLLAGVCKPNEWGIGLGIMKVLLTSDSL